MTGGSWAGSPAVSASLPTWLADVRREKGAELVQTHISWLLLTSDTVYKVKKPLRLDFVDYSTPARRLHFCHEEVRLNSRFAPQLYRGVTRLGPLEEPAVVMRRFDESNRLDHLCARGELTTEQVGSLVQQVVALHRDSPAAPAGALFGSPEIMARQVDNCLDDLADTGVAAVVTVTRLGDLLRSRLRQLHPALTDRQAAGHIREGHGDLHLANVVILDGAVTMFDGIEFSADLRWLDVASELAFTYADLLDHGRPDLAAMMVHEWLVATGDIDGVALLRFYASYRAAVRAMTAGMVGDAGTTQGYLDQALRLAGRNRRPRLIITHGVAGSGKSTAARRWVATDPEAASVWLRSDVERKRLFGLAPQASSNSPVAGGLYTADATARTYARLAELAGRALVAGWSVVVDATFAEPADRQRFAALAGDCDADFGILDCTASESVLRTRVAARRGDVSEATLAVLEQQLASFRPLTAHERSLCVATDQTG